MRFLVLILIMSLSAASWAVHEPWTTTVYPQDEEKLWWDDAWWEEGRLDRPESYEVSMEEISYSSGDAEIPAYLFKPKKPGKLNAQQAFMQGKLKIGGNMSYAMKLGPILDGLKGALPKM